jgi:O-antigen/teichoic acid export membrane protein
MNVSGRVARGSFARVMRNAGWTMAAYVIPALVGLATIPPLLKGLGPERFGLLSLVYLLIGYLGPLDLGISRAGTRALARSFADKDRQEVGLVLWSGMTGLVIIGSVAGATVYLARHMLTHSIFGVEAPFDAEAASIIGVVGMAAPLLLLRGITHGAVEAAERFDLSGAVKVAFSLLNYTIPLAGLWLGWTLTQIVAGLMVTAALSVAAYLVLLHTFVGLPLRPRFSRSCLVRLFRFGSGVTLSSVAIVAVGQLDKLIVVAVLGLPALGIYAVAQEVASRLLLVPTAFAAAAFPQFSVESAHHAGGSLFARTTASAVIMVFLPAIIFIGAGPELLSMWLGPEFGASAGFILQILCLSIYTSVIGYIAFAFVQATGRPGTIAAIQWLQLPLFAMALWLLATWLGLAGVAIAVVLRTLVEVPVFVWLAARFDRSVVPALHSERSFHAILSGFLCLALALMVTAGWSSAHVRIGASAALTGAFIAYVWYVGPLRAEFEAVRARLHRQPVLQ